MLPITSNHVWRLNTWLETAFSPRISTPTAYLSNWTQTGTAQIVRSWCVGQLKLLSDRSRWNREWTEAPLSWFVVDPWVGYGSSHIVRGGYVRKLRLLLCGSRWIRESVWATLLSSVVGPRVKWGFSLMVRGGFVSRLRLLSYRPWLIRE